MAPDPSKSRRLADLGRLRRVRDRMDREFARPLDVDSLAADAHMSPGHFSRSFRAAYGESPYSYLMTRRIERAMTLLRNSDMSVSRICLEVGAASLGSFSSRFSDVVGVSPTAYREKAGGSLDGLAPCVVRRSTKPVRNRETASSGSA